MAAIVPTVTIAVVAIIPSTVLNESEVARS
jgi:hypothetical protein